MNIEKDFIIMYNDFTLPLRQYLVQTNEAELKIFRISSNKIFFFNIHYKKKKK